MPARTESARREGGQPTHLGSAAPSLRVRRAAQRQNGDVVGASTSGDAIEAFVAQLLHRQLRQLGEHADDTSHALPEVRSSLGRTDWRLADEQKSRTAREQNRLFDMTRGELRRATVFSLT